MSAEVADVLERAAARIEEVGKSGPGEQGRGPNGETCALNAIDYASFSAAGTGLSSAAKASAAKTVLRRQVGCLYLSVWSDSRTQAEVVAALRAAAEQERAS